MIVTFVRKFGNASVVLYRDKYNVQQACIVDTKYVKSTKPWSKFEIHSKAIKESTPYGIDWSVVYPDGLVLYPDLIQEAFYKKGIITISDLTRNTNDVISVINSLTRMNCTMLINNVRTVLGGE